MLFSGDVAVRRYPRFSSPTSGVKVWQEALELIAGLNAEFVVPSHGPMGDARVIESYDEFFATLQSRVRELKDQGRSVDTIAELLTRELEPRYPDWPGEGVERIGDIARIAHAETL